jgi:hypothetical protein
MTTIPNRRVAHNTPNACSIISTDLNLAGFHFWSHLKNTVNVMTVKDVEEIQNRVDDGGKSIRKTHRIFEHAQSLRHATHAVWKHKDHHLNIFLVIHYQDGNL